MLLAAAFWIEDDWAFKVLELTKFEAAWEFEFKWGIGDLICCMNDWAFCTPLFALDSGVALIRPLLF